MLLVTAAALVGAPWWARALLALAVALHGLARRPAATPPTILVADNGACCVPTLEAAWLEPGPRTLLAAHWLRLSLSAGGRTHDILLCADQIDAESWARVNARLRRRRAAGTAAAPAGARADRADLR